MLHFFNEEVSLFGQARLGLDSGRKLFDEMCVRETFNELACFFLDTWLSILIRYRKPIDTVLTSDMFCSMLWATSSVDQFCYLHFSSLTYEHWFHLVLIHKF